MYKKKKNMAIIITVIAAVIIAGVLFLVMNLTNRQPKVQETEVSTEVEELPVSHQILIHKTNAGILEFEQKWLRSDSDTKTILEVEEATLVSMRVKPMDGKYLDSVNIYDAKSVSTAINHVITKLDGGDYNIDFTMPETDIVMTFQFENYPVEDSITQEVSETDVESETEGNPYGLTLHGITADVITSFNGQFDDRDFMQQIGSALHMDSARSEYHEVTDITFSTEEYEGAKDSDKVYYYVYFNTDPNWKVLATYHLKEHVYVFTEPAVKETEPEVQPEQTPTYSSGNTGTQADPVSTTSVVASLDILSVSNNFLKYTGGEESRFYDAIFNYVVEEKGKTGEMTGTFAEFEINPEEQLATFLVTLNNGGKIEGSYDHQKNSYSFSGL